MKLTESIETLEKLEASTHKTLVKHQQLIGKLLSQEQVDPPIAKTLKAHERSLKAFCTQVDEVINLMFHALGEAAKTTMYFGELEGARVVEERQRLQASERGRQNVKAKHLKNDFIGKKEALLNLWSSGKYKTKQICADQEHEALGMSFDVARKALARAPNPKRPLTK